MRAILKSLTAETSKLLVHAFINSRLDYCNSVLHSVGAVHLRKLQFVQSWVAQIVARKRNYDPMTSTLRDDLHWLPVESRIRFLQCTLVNKNLHGTAPVYIVKICIRHSFDSEHYQLRSAVRGELFMKKITLGRRSFRYAGPSLWNAPRKTFVIFLFHLANFGQNIPLSPILSSLTAEAPSWWIRHKLALSYMDSVTN